MTLIPELSVQEVLVALGDIVSDAEASGEFEVGELQVEFAHVTVKTVGTGVPAFWVVPKDLLSGDVTQTDTQRLAFVLKRRRVSPDAAKLRADVQAAARVVRAGFAALSGLRSEFEASARLEFKFEVSVEGKISFVLRAGGKRADANTLALTLTPK